MDLRLPMPQPKGRLRQPGNKITKDSVHILTDFSEHLPVVAILTLGAAFLAPFFPREKVIVISLKPATELIRRADTANFMVDFFRIHREWALTVLASSEEAPIRAKRTYVESTKVKLRFLDREKSGT